MLVSHAVEWWVVLQCAVVGWAWGPWTVVQWLVGNGAVPSGLVCIDSVCGGVVGLWDVDSAAVLVVSGAVIQCADSVGSDAVTVAFVQFLCVQWHGALYSVQCYGGLVCLGSCAVAWWAVV